MSVAKRRFDELFTPGLKPSAYRENLQTVLAQLNLMAVDAGKRARVAEASIVGGSLDAAHARGEQLAYQSAIRVVRLHLDADIPDSMKLTSPLREG